MELTFRITVVDPPPGVAFRMQRGRAELVPPTRETAASLTFDFPLRVERGAAGGAVRLLGAFAQGPPAKRFVYVNSGKRAGQASSCWDRRAKVRLDRIDSSLIDEALASPGSVIATTIAGRTGDGGPACATVPLVDGWRVVR